MIIRESLATLSVSSLEIFYETEDLSAQHLARMLMALNDRRRWRETAWTNVGTMLGLHKAAPVLMIVTTDHTGEIRGTQRATIDKNDRQMIDNSPSRTKAAETLMLHRSNQETW